MTAADLSVPKLYLDQPTIRTGFAGEAAALLVSYGSSADPFPDVPFGAARPGGTAPVRPAVLTRGREESRSDVVDDSANPAFGLGDGLSYAGDAGC